MDIHGTPRKPLKLGTVQTVDMETGEVTSEQRNAMTLMPCAPGVCQVCAVDHPHDEPHNQKSLYYQMAFHATHGRWPTWTDAMAHCTPEIKARARKALISVMQQHGLPIPEDLQTEKPGSSR